MRAGYGAWAQLAASARLLPRRRLLRQVQFDSVLHLDELIAELESHPLEPCGRNLTKIERRSVAVDVIAPTRVWLATLIALRGGATE
jgi:hypothetical protein